MEFLKDCSSGVGPSNHKNMKKSSYREVEVAFFSGSNSNKHKECQSLVTYVHRKPSSIPLWDGWTRFKQNVVFMELLCQ
jgi:hypothetical protein